ncbi:hypothetical protein N326_10837, partial [Eurypyga helias]
CLWKSTVEERLLIICVTLVLKKPYGNIKATFNLKKPDSLYNFYRTSQRALFVNKISLVSLKAFGSQRFMLLSSAPIVMHRHLSLALHTVPTRAIFTRFFTKELSERIQRALE